ncbi:hypothetical protein ACWD74_35485, partial [Streptomyces fagopyri]
MPGSLPRVLRFTAVAAAVQTTAVMLATRAVAAPVPKPSRSNDPCDLLIGPAKQYCSQDSGSRRSGTTSPSLTSPLDPLSSLAKGCADAASWTIDKLSSAVNDTA